MVLPPALVVIAAAGPPAPGPSAAAEGAYRAEVEAWRRDREARLRAPDGWLSLVGLSWLHAGANRFGSAPDDEVPLPASAPPHAGALLLEGGTVRLSLTAGVSATLNGRKIEAETPIAIRSDAGDATPDILGLGGATVQVIARGGRLGARVKDPNSVARKRFAGCAWYPIAPAYRVTARLTPHAAKLVVPDATGGRQELESPGTLTFTLAGRELHLDPVRDGADPGDLLVVFRDGTSGRETYGAGRFLRARRATDGTFTVDFNQAYAPPCAYTPFATCPLPPPQNRLPLNIPAGERSSAGAADHRAP